MKLLRLHLLSSFCKFAEKTSGDCSSILTLLKGARRPTCTCCISSFTVPSSSSSSPVSRRSLLGPSSVTLGPSSNRFLSSSHASHPSPSSAIVLDASERHTATVFFLHGLGSSGHNWARFLYEISAPHIKYVFPHAPVMPVTAYSGVKMPAWFDMRTMRKRGCDEQGIKEAANSVHRWLDAEIDAGKRKTGLKRSLDL